MKNKFFIIGVTTIGVILTFLYIKVVISNPQRKFKEYRTEVSLKGNRARAIFKLTLDSYFLKIKHVIKNEQSKDIFLNGIKFKPDIYNYVKRRGIIETNWIYIPKKYIREGENIIDIYFPKNQPPDVDITFTNYRKKIGNNIYLLFSDSAQFSSSKPSLKIICLAIALVSLFFVLLIYFVRRFLTLSTNKIFLLQTYSLLPFLVFLFFLTLNYKIYRITISSSYFWKFGLISFFSTECFLVIKKLWQGYTKNELTFVNRQLKGNVIKTIEWLKKKEFEDKCIILFIVLLVVCAVLLLLDLNIIAEPFAYIGYFSLVIGLAIKFKKFINEGAAKE